MSYAASGKLSPLAFFAFRALVFLTPIASVSWAQITTGALSGTVTDASGGVLVGAKVEVTNQGTGVVTPLVTNDAGLYRAVFLVPGTYSVRIQASGFRTFEAKDIVVELAREPVINAKLQIGEATQTVEVQGSAPLLVTDTSQISTNVQREIVMSLPGVQGGMDKLALTSPGVVVGFGNINSNGLLFSANGQRARSNNFLLDGQDNNDPTIAGPGYAFNALEAVGEYQVITNQYSAEYGRNAGAIVNIRVKSGTNAFHGAGTYFRRDDQNWTALDNIQKGVSGLKNPPKYLDSILGGQFEGPIVRNKVFFNIWTQREWVRQNASYIGTGSTLAPTPAGLQQLQAYFPNSIPLANYVKYGAYAQNIGTLALVPNSTVNQNITAPSGQVISVPFASLQRLVATPSDIWDAGAHADYHFSDKMQFTGKYYDQRNNTPYSASNGQAGYFIGSPSHSRQAGGSWIWAATPTMVNEFRFSFIKSEFDSFGGNTFGFDNLTQNIANATINGYLGYGLAYNLPQYRLVNSYQYQDNLSKQLGRHSLKMGFQFINDKIPIGFLPNVDGVYTYSNFQQYLNNTPATFAGAAGVTTEEPHELDQAYYFQDDFRFRPNLTLNLGLRYEYSGQPINLLNDETVARESNSQTAIWNPALPLSARTYPKYPAPSKDFAPRVGLAWTPTANGGLIGKLLGNNATVIRAGFAIAWDPAFYNLFLNGATAAPVVFAYTLNYTTGTYPAMPADITGANLQKIYAPPAGVDPRTLAQTLFASNFKNPYSESYTFGIQRQIGARMGLEIRYVGTQGVDQFATRNGNPYVAGFVSNGFGNILPSGVTPGVNPTCSACNGRVDPAYNVIRLRDNSAHSSYNGLQTAYTMRNLANQLTLTSAFTWSKTMDNISEVYTFTSSGSIVLAQNPFNVTSGERGLSNNNIPLAFSLTANWELPWLKKPDRWYNRLLGGWSIGAFEVAQAGRPMTVLQASTNLNVMEDAATVGLVGGSATLRPFLANPNAPLSSVGEFLPNGTLVNLANTSQQVSISNVHWIANTVAADKYFGTPFGVPRNTLTGPILQQLNLSVFKNFAIRENLRVQIRAEATNAFNHVNYPLPNLNVDVSTATTFLNPTYQEAGVSTNNPPRIIRLGVRIVF
jgi:outer membrane receptor protein involved in Fe transport